MPGRMISTRPSEASVITATHARAGRRCSCGYTVMRRASHPRQALEREKAARGETAASTRSNALRRATPPSASITSSNNAIANPLRRHGGYPRPGRVQTRDCWQKRDDVLVFLHVTNDLSRSVFGYAQLIHDASVPSDQPNHVDVLLRLAVAGRLNRLSDRSRERDVLQELSRRGVEQDRHDTGRPQPRHRSASIGNWLALDPFVRRGFVPGRHLSGSSAACPSSRRISTRDVFLTQQQRLQAAIEKYNRRVVDLSDGTPRSTRRTARSWKPFRHWKSSFKVALFLARPTAWFPMSLSPTRQVRL